MFEIKGKINTAVCYAKVIEDEAIEQIRRMCDYEFTAGSRIRIMPDVHAGKGCTIGTTMTIVDKAVPNVVGVDIGCGMYTVRLGDQPLDLARNDDVTFAVRKNEDSKISLYNKNGEELIHEEFDDIEEFPEELDICAVECEGKVGFIDRKGNYLLEPTFDAYQGDDMDLPVNPCFWGKDFGLIPDKKTGRYALLDKDFNVITDYKFTDIGPVDCGLIAVCDDKGWSVVNTKGEEVIPSGEYEEIDTIFKNGMILVKDSGSGKYGFVNADGEQLTEFKYEVYHWTD